MIRERGRATLGPDPSKAETLQGWGGSDPDDLAIVCCAALRYAGTPYSVAFDVSDGRATAVHILSNGRLVGVFPMHPTVVSAETLAMLTASIELTGQIPIPYQLDESTVRFEERHVITRMLTGMALESTGKRSRLATLQDAITRIANREHHKEAWERVQRVKEELQESALREGESIAETLFKERVALSLSWEDDLAPALAVAYKRGFEHGYERGATLGFEGGETGGDHGDAACQSKTST